MTKKKPFLFVFFPSIICGMMTSFFISMRGYFAISNNIDGVSQYVIIVSSFSSLFTCIYKLLLQWVKSASSDNHVDGLTMSFDWIMLSSIIKKKKKLRGRMHTRNVFIVHIDGPFWAYRKYKNMHVTFSKMLSILFSCSSILSRNMSFRSSDLCSIKGLFLAH